MPDSNLIVIWHTRVQLLSADAGNLRWDVAAYIPRSAAIVVKGQSLAADPVIYVGSDTGVISKLAFSTGAEIAQIPNVEGPVYGLAYADGVIYANVGNNLTANDVNAPSGQGLLWTQPMDNLGWGNPVVSDGIIYSGSWDGKLYAIKANGTPAWISTAFNFWDAIPIVANGIVYATAWNKLVALDAQTGAVIWQTNTPNDASIHRPVSFGDGRIYLAAGWGRLLCAFDSANGDLLWSVDFGAHPGEATYCDGRVFASGEHNFDDGYLKAFDAVDGHLLWTSSVPVGGSGHAVSRAIFDEGPASGLVFVTSQNGHAYAFRRSDGSLAWQRVIGNDLAWPIDPTWTDAVAGPNLEAGDYVTVDPWALRLKNDLYVKLNLPYPPPIEYIVDRVLQAEGGMSPSDRQMALAQLRRLEGGPSLLRQALEKRRG